MIYLNGQFLSAHEATIDTKDRGFLLSDGLFETIRVYQGKPFALEKHWLRLKKSAEYLELPIDLSYEQLEKITAKLLSMNTGEATLRLTLTRGVGPRGLNYPEPMKPTVLIAVFPYTEQKKLAAKIATSTIRRNEYSPLAHIKSLAYLDNILARREIVKRGFDEAILLNTKGHVAETSSANIFIVTNDNILLTPHLNDGALPGITRDIVLSLANSLHILSIERSIHPDELFTAKEIFLTNSIIELQAVEQVHDKTLASDNPVTRELQMAYKVLTRSPCAHE